MCILTCRTADAASFLGGSSSSTAKTSSSTARRAFFDSNDSSTAAVEAEKSLADFHVGSWRGTAQSFGVSPDVAAGILARRKSPPYTLHVSKHHAAWQERMEWTSADSDSSTSSSSVRTVDFAASNMDVDAVDASYSLDVTLPDLSSALTGSDQLPQFMVEHCIAVSDHARARLLALYSATDQSLMRVVVCEETRIMTKTNDNDAASAGTTRSTFDNNASLSMSDLVEMQADVDRLVDKIVGQVEQQQQQQNPESAESNGILMTGTEVEKTAPSIADMVTSLSASKQQDQEQPYSNGDDKSTTDELSNGLARHPVSLLELSSGIWMGDAVVRDMSSAAKAAAAAATASGQGFGTSAAFKQEQQRSAIFGDWTLGVTKIAWRWMWRFSEEIRQVVDVGKNMGTTMVAPARSMAGSVCVNEGLSRRIKKEDRMVYIDWAGDNVGFLVGSVSIQVCLLFDDYVL
jgi:hypothetical protein